MNRGKWHRLEMLVEPEWLDELDEWRTRQVEIPSRSVAIRFLVQQAIRGTDVGFARMTPATSPSLRPKREGIVSRVIRLAALSHGDEKEGML